MVFARDKNRDKLRKEQTRSDWLFDRANDRKRHQKLLTDAEWYNRRSFSKYCDEDGCKTIDKVSFLIHMICLKLKIQLWIYFSGCSALRFFIKEKAEKIQRQRLQTWGNWTFEVRARVQVFQKVNEQGKVKS